MQGLGTSSKRRSLSIAFALAFLTAGGNADAQHLLHGASGLDHGIPDLCPAPTIVSSHTGAWSDPTTWNPARRPVAGDSVAVAAGMTVTYDVVDSGAMRCVGVDGILRFKPDIDTQLTVGDLLVRPSGTLEVGTESAPIATARTATIVIADKPIDTAADPEQFGTGLVVTGRIRIHGEAKPRTFLRTTSELKPGESTFEVEQEAAGWKTGDRLVVPDSRYYPMSERGALTTWWPGLEVVTLGQGVGNRLTLTKGLRTAHPGARNGDGKVEFLPHVGNLTRNVVIRSQSPAGTRGHVMFVARADVDVRYAAFQNLGRTTLTPLDSAAFDASGKVTHTGKNQIGRYAVHFHHLIGPPTTPAGGFQFTFIGNAVESSSKWGMAIHHSHYGLIKDNVLYDTKGSGIMTEDGSESFNVIERNFIVKIDGDGNRGDKGEGTVPNDFGTEGTGIWLRGPNNYVRQNVVSNAVIYGYMLYFGTLGTVKIPAQKGGDPGLSGQGTAVNFAQTKLLEFADNEAYADRIGMTLWYADGPVVLKRMRIWHAMTDGFYGYPHRGVVMDGWIIRGDPAALADPTDWSTGIGFGDYEARNATIVRADIQNMRYGITPAIVANDPWAGPNAPVGTTTIQDSYFRNYFDVAVRTMYFNGGPSRMSPKAAVIRNSKFVAPTVTGDPTYPPQAIMMSFLPNTLSNNVQKDRVLVYDFNQVKGDDFQVFYLEQKADFPLPTVGENGVAQAAGLTNQQSWERYRVAIGGQVTPCMTRRERVWGFACTISEAPADTRASAAPNAPSNVRLVR